MRILIFANSSCSTTTTMTKTITSMDTSLLITTLAITLLFIAVSTYFLFFLAGKAAGKTIYLVGPTGAGKTALWSFVRHRDLKSEH
jgi:flagellar biosynthesis GTPase FlhF